MSKHICGIVVIFLGSTLFLSCIPSNKSKTVETVETVAIVKMDGDSSDLSLLTEQELVDQYREVIKNAEKSMGMPIYFALGAQLATFGPQALGPLIEFLGDSSNSPRERVVTAEVLKFHIQPSNIPSITHFLETTYDGTTRGSAVYLLGFLPGVDTNTILRGLLDDDEPRVAFGAKIGLARVGDDAALEGLKAMYGNEGTSEAELFQIVGIVLSQGRSEDVDFLSAAVVNEEITEQQRVEVATALGRLGDPGALPALEQCSREGGEALKTVALAAIEAIQEVGESKVIDSSA